MKSVINKLILSLEFKQLCPNSGSTKRLSVQTRILPEKSGWLGRGQLSKFVAELLQDFTRLRELLTASFARITIIYTRPRIVRSFLPGSFAVRARLN